MRLPDLSDTDTFYFDEAFQEHAKCYAVVFGVRSGRDHYEWFSVDHCRMDQADLNWARTVLGPMIDLGPGAFSAYQLGVAWGKQFGARTPHFSCNKRYMKIEQMLELTRGYEDGRKYVLGRGVRAVL
jgi:hypothetical protein